MVKAEEWWGGAEGVVLVVAVEEGWRGVVEGGAYDEEVGGANVAKVLSCLILCSTLSSFS